MTPQRISDARTWILTALASLALIATIAAPAQAERKTFRAVSSTANTVVFKIRGLSPAEVRRGLARVQRREGGSQIRRISARKLRAAIARGKLRVRSTSAVRGGTLRVSYRRKPRPTPPADTTAPETTITSGPTGTITTDSANLGFSASEGGSTFQCQLDSSAWSSCSNPKAYSGLGEGSHAVAVRATDAAGNTDASPATRSFTVDTSTPDPDPDPDPDPLPDVCDLVAALTSSAFGAPACWRPYSDSSPFNRKVPANAPVLSNSSQIVNRWIGFGNNAPKFDASADTSYDYDHPIYYSKPTDPQYTVACTEWVSSCEVHGNTLRIPSGAKPAEGSDGHMTVIDMVSGTEYDFWQVKSKPAGGGTITVSHGGKTSLTGDGRGSAATAGHFGLAAGVIRPEELAAGKIDHALFMVVNCTSGRVDPASTGTGRLCSSIGQSNTNAPRMGEHFVLDMTEAEINALPTAQWRKTILHAMREYGLIVGDTGGGMMKVQSGTSWTSLGLADKWQQVGQSLGAQQINDAQGPLQRFDLRTTIDWASQMKVVDPCVSTGTC